MRLRTANEKGTYELTIWLMATVLHISCQVGISTLCTELSHLAHAVQLQLAPGLGEQRRLAQQHSKQPPHLHTCSL